ncbi:hypothetical protein C5F49_03375 [Nitrosopumilus oxyclinae]|uniref:Uncharacterized protein n=1 Tax=Nitrosopumilus oxyclinae TaxID=1959104 RepID=A0A7D5R824_9ARCH|nr:hypothetical protein [Nitrosopumilus oxyclinae]QLH04464.1 hypothetical protein C5F49_03375 [Nitrosopumilus oxyclinae]
MVEEPIQNNETKEDEPISLCDVLKTDTSEIIKKLEAQAPSIFQNNSNLYTQYLHLFDDMFGTCYISEKEFFDKLNIDPKILKQIKENSESIKKSYLNLIDMNTKYWDEYFKMRVSAVKSFDSFIHTMMESYAKTLSKINESSNKNKE